MPDESMRVCEASAFGGPEVLREASRPWPLAGPGEVVVTIAAANINPSDIAARSGAHRHRLPDLQPPFVPGWDLAGVVSEVGPGPSAYAVGDRVAGMIPWVRIGGRTGAYAEAAAVDRSWLAPLEPGLDFVSAATIPLNALTAHQALALINAPAGSTLLITGASGAVGGFAVQLAARAGVRVLAVASSGDEEWVAGLGAASVLARDVDYGSLSVDALFDAVPIGAAAAAAVREGGAAVFTRRVGEIEGRPHLRVETPLVHTDPAALAELVSEVVGGRLRTRVAHSFDLADGAEAHRVAEQGGRRGKVVLTTS